MLDRILTAFPAIFAVSYFFSDTYYNYLEYTVRIKPEVFKDKTKLKQAYDELIKDPPRSEFFFIDTSTEIKNLVHPFKHYLNTKLNYLNPDYTQFSDIWFNKIKMHVDDNYLYPSTVI